MKRKTGAAAVVREDRSYDDPLSARAERLEFYYRRVLGGSGEVRHMVPFKQNSFQGFPSALLKSASG